MENVTEFVKPCTPVDTHFWISYYTDGSADMEDGDRLFPDLPFKSIEHFTIMPKMNAEYKIAICIEKEPGYILVWRKSRHVDFNGNYYGSDYQLGLEPDDGTELLETIEKGQESINKISKNSPLGFRIWLTKDGELRQSGAFKKTEKIQYINGEQFRYITCGII